MEMFLDEKLLYKQKTQSPIHHNVKLRFIHQAGEIKCLFIYRMGKREATYIFAIGLFISTLVFLMLKENPEKLKYLIIRI